MKNYHIVKVNLFDSQLRVIEEAFVTKSHIILNIRCSEVEGKYSVPLTSNQKCQLDEAKKCGKELSVELNMMQCSVLRQLNFGQCLEYNPIYECNRKIIRKN